MADVIVALRARRYQPSVAFHQEQTVRVAQYE
jgi:hypothetical protein